MKRLITSLVVMLGLLVPTLVPATAGAVEVFDACSGAANTAVCKGKDDKLLGPDGLLTRIINLLLTIIGIIAVIMIIVGGIRYSISGGDSGQVKSAKDTIIFAVVGLVVAIMSFAIVNFVLMKI